MTKLPKILKRVNETLLPSPVRIIHHVPRQYIVFDSPGLLSIMPVPAVDEGNTGVSDSVQTVRTSSSLFSVTLMPDVLQVTLSRAMCRPHSLKDVLKDCISSAFLQINQSRCKAAELSN